MLMFVIEYVCVVEDLEMIVVLVDGCGLELINCGQFSLIYCWCKYVLDEIVECYLILVFIDVWLWVSDFSLGEVNWIIDELLVCWGESCGDGLMGDQYFFVLVVKVVVVLQKDDLELCIVLVCWVEVQFGQNVVFFEVVVLIIVVLVQVVCGQGDQVWCLLGLVQQCNYFFEGCYLDM